MKVYADDVGGCDYLTNKKIYEFRHSFVGIEKGSFGGWITDDKGYKRFIYTHSSSHISYNKWTVIND